MRDFFQFLPFLFLFLVVTAMVRGAAKMLRKLNESQPVPRSPATFDPAEAERTRRIQEEIRRKIAERRGAMPTPMPVSPDGFPTRPAAAPVNLPEEPPQLAATAAVLARQRQLAEQMRALETARRAEQRKTTALVAAVEAESAQAVTDETMRGNLLADLRVPATARRAILLREILGSPVALR